MNVFEALMIIEQDKTTCAHEVFSTSYTMYKIIKGYKYKKKSNACCVSLKI